MRILSKIFLREKDHCENNPIDVDKRSRRLCVMNYIAINSPDDLPLHMMTTFIYCIPFAIVSNIFIQKMSEIDNKSSGDVPTLNELSYLFLFPLEEVTLFFHPYDPVYI